MLDKSTYLAFPIHPFCLPKIPFLHTVIKVQAKIRESNEQGCRKPPTWQEVDLEVEVEDLHVEVI